MNIRVSKFKNGIPMLKITLLNKAQRRKVLVNNPEVVELMVLAYTEGQHEGGNLLKLIEDLKR